VYGLPGPLGREKFKENHETNIQRFQKIEQLLFSLWQVTQTPIGFFAVGA
jgi:hypothetical protein